MCYQLSYYLFSILLYTVCIIWLIISYHTFEGIFSLSKVKVMRNKYIRIVINSLSYLRATLLFVYDQKRICCVMADE